MIQPSNSETIEDSFELERLPSFIEATRGEFAFYDERGYAVMGETTFFHFEELDLAGVASEVLLLRTIYVAPEARNKGSCKAAIKVIVNALEATGTALISISNPFEYAEFPSDFDERKRYFRTVQSCLFPRQYMHPQKVMRRRFETAGFTEVDLTAEWNGAEEAHRKRVSKKDCLIYIPRTASPVFLKTIADRVNLNERSDRLVA